MENEVVQQAAANLDVLKFVGAGLATLGTIGAAIGVGMIFAAGINGIARNPGAEAKIKPLVMFGMAMAEALGIVSLVIGLYLAFAA